MIDNLFFSIIVPAYNVEKYISECISSVLNQKFNSYELLIVNDGSTDNTKSIINTYRDNKNIVLLEKENGGLSSARNFALERATGKYVIFLDGDDSLANGALENIHEALVKDETDILFTPHIRVSETNDFRPQIIGISKRILNGLTKNLVVDYNDGQLGYEVWRKVYKRSIISEHNINFYDNKIIFAEDIYFNNLFLRYAKTYSFVNEPTHIYRARSNSLFHSQKTEFKIDKYVKLFEILKEKENNDDILYYFWSSLFYEYQQHVESSEDYLKSAREIIPECFYDVEMDKLNAIFPQNGRKYETFINECKLGLEIKKHVFNLRHFIKRALIYANKVFKVLKYKLITSTKLPIVWKFGNEYVGNLGDVAISIMENKMIYEANKKARIIEFDSHSYYKNKFIVCKYIKPKDLIILPGGGNFGTLYDYPMNIKRDAASCFKNNKIIVFPCSIFYGDDSYSKTLLEFDENIFTFENITIYCRESVSFEFAKKHFECNVKLCPDVVLHMKPKKVLERNKVLLCFRNDLEKKVDDNFLELLKDNIKDKNFEIIDTLLPYPYSKKYYIKNVYKYLDKFASSSLVITDRLHGMIFAASCKTPVIAIPGIYHKITSVYELIKKDVDVLCIDAQDLISNYKINISTLNTLHNKNFLDFKNLLDDLKL